MPEHLPGTNMWNLLEGEYFVTTDHEIVEGPQHHLKVEEFPRDGLISVKTVGEDLFEVEDPTGEGFEKVVHKNES